MKDRSDNGSVNDALISTQKALLGIGDLEEGVLNKIKEHLDKMLNNLYTQIKSYQHIATKELMVSENPITDADRALLAIGLANISDRLNEKNVELVRIAAELSALGLDVSISDNKSIEALRQSLDELNKRNRILRNIRRELAKHPMITGKIPAKGISLKDVELMLKTLNKQIQALHQANNEFRQQLIKPKTEVSSSTPRMKR